MNVSLKELIETGRFGAVRLGMSRAEVESSLGAPDDVGGTSNKYPKPSVWKYGDVELHFVLGEDSLFLIHMDEFDVPSGGKLDSFDPWIISRSLTLSEAEAQLSQSGIDYELGDYDVEEEATQITAGVGVKLTFAGRDPSLSAVSYVRR